MEDREIAELTRPVTEDEQINHAHQEITDAGAVLDPARLRALAHLAEARLEALSTGRTDGPTGGK